jgi:shikimate kinase
MKLVLLGYMGVGKSTLGRLFAETFQLKFIDLDSYIENREQLSIPELFKEKGEIYFRRVESESLKEILSGQNHFVLSLGGGTPVYANNMEQIKESKGVTSVYLKLQLKELVDRLFEQRLSRPLISHYTDKDEFEEFVRKHLFERQPFYFMADQILDVTDKTPSMCLEALINLLNRNT